MVTMKFGGTSVQDADAISNVVRIVRDALPKNPVVVISAIAQATNTLEQIGRRAREGERDAALALIHTLIGRHREIVDRLITDTGRKADLHAEFKRTAEVLGGLADGVGKLGELTPRTIDALCCHGELLSSRIVAAALMDADVPAVWIDTADFLITDESHTRARPQMRIVEERLRDLVLPLLSQGRIPVTQGFIGATLSGVRTTMGRESSDYTGALIGGLLGAAAIEIWTDVTGVLTADPRIVESTRGVGNLTFDEAFELTYYGAKVLHPKTMEPAREKNIPIHILNSRNPDLPGTVVTATPDGQRAGAKSVTCRKNIGVLTLAPRGRHGQNIFREQVFGILAENGVEALMTASSEYRTAVVCAAPVISPFTLKALAEVCDAEFVSEGGLVCLVGHRLMHTPGLAERFCRAVGDLPVRFLSYGPSGDSFGMVIDAVEIDDAVRRVHAEFFGSDGTGGR